MQLIAPLSLWWLLLALPIVVLYLRKVRRRRVTVPSVLFWDQVFDQRKPRTIWQRVRNILSLVLQLLFLALLTLALTDPSPSGQDRRARTVVLVVDNSASMSATDVSPNRLAWAKRIAAKQIRGLRETESMAIISAASARLEIGLNSHPRVLQRALHNLMPTDSPARLEEAVALGSRLIEGKANGEIVVLTDHPLDGETADGPVRYVNCGTLAGNVGITQFQVRRTLNDRVGFQVLVKVANLSGEAVQLRLEIASNDRLLDVLPLKLQAEEVWESVLDYTSAEAAAITATIDRADSLLSDNRAVAELVARRPQDVLLVTPGSLYLESVLRSIPQVNLTVQDDVPDVVPDGVVMVVHRTELRKIPQGRLFVVDPVSESECWSLETTSRDAIVGKQDDSSPLMRHVRLLNSHFSGVPQIAPRVPHDVLMESLDGTPLYFVVERPAARLLVLATELHTGDLPLRTAFPILMSNALDWFRGSQGELRPALATGQIMSVSMPEPAIGAPQTAPRKLVLRDPFGRQRPVAATYPEVVVGPLDQAGLWELQRATAGGAPTGPVLRLACNLVNARESDIRTRPRAEPEPSGRTATGYPIWFLLVMAALILTGMEWTAYQRRWIE